MFSDACGAHVCMWCMYVYMVHLCTHVSGDACMYKWCILVMHVVHVCVCHMCVCVCVVHLCTCVWCMCVYMVHIYAPVIGDACGVHAFQVLFTFQVCLFMCFSLFRCFSCAFYFSGVLFTFHMCFSCAFHF